jgi:hypothetical protein
MKSCVIHALGQIVSGWCIKADEMVWTCRIYGREDKVLTKNLRSFCLKSVKKRGIFEDLRVEDGMILKLVPSK